MKGLLSHNEHSHVGNMFVFLFLPLVQLIWLGDHGRNNKLFLCLHNVHPFLHYLNGPNEARAVSGMTRWSLLLLQGRQFSVKFENENIQN